MAFLKNYNPLENINLYHRSLKDRHPKSILRCVVIIEFNWEANLMLIFTVPDSHDLNM
jgi:hypothetical protein